MLARSFLLLMAIPLPCSSVVIFFFLFFDFHQSI
jgi:hypothetical protein